MNSQDNMKHEEQGSTSEESTAVSTEDNDKNSKSHVKLSFYWSTAFIFCCFNICNCGVFIAAYLFKHPNLSTTDGTILTAFITKMAIILFLCILHLGVAVFAVHISKPKVDHHSSSEEPQSMHTIHNCCSSHDNKLKVLQILPLYTILIFIQTIGTAAIPLFILLVLYKFEVLSILAFLSSSSLLNQS